MSISVFKIVAFVAGLAFSTVSAAEEQAPWTHPDVLRAAAQINLTDAQLKGFRSHVAEFLQGYGSDVARLMRANNQTNLPRKIAGKRRARVSNMDERMGDLLTAEQLPAYQSYRDTLLQKMDERAAARRR